MKYLAIDYGGRRCGLAICDESETIVSPLAVIKDRKGVLEQIVGLIKKENIEAVVIGLPLNMDDSVGGQARLVYDFAKHLEKEIEIPIHFQDERLSTFAAKEKLEGIEISKKKKRERLDAIAAAGILESFLEAKKTKGSSGQV